LLHLESIGMLFAVSDNMLFASNHGLTFMEQEMIPSVWILCIHIWLEIIQKCILKENKNPGPIIYTAGAQHMTTKYSTFSTWFADVKLICTCSKVVQITFSQKCQEKNKWWRSPWLLMSSSHSPLQVILKNAHEH
jgi:hypothetical protein